MNVQTAKAFRISIIVGLVAYTAYWFSPYSYGYLDPNIGSVLSYSGYGAIYSGNNIVDVAMFVMWIVGASGMFFYRKIARCFFLLLNAITLGVTPLYGIFVETAGAAALIDVAHIAVGVALALAYFSSVRDQFY